MNKFIRQNFSRALSFKAVRYNNSEGHLLSFNLFYLNKLIFMLKPLLGVYYT